MMSELRAIKHMVDLIENAVEGVDREPITIVAERIVNRMWANRDVNAADFELNYPEVDIIVNLAADIEIIKEDDEYRRELWRSLLINFEILKEKVAKAEYKRTDIL